MNVGSSGGGTPPGIRAALAAERADTLARLAGLEREFSGIVTAAQSANTDDEHDPEGATIAWERQHVVALLDQAREQLGPLRGWGPADRPGAAGRPPDAPPLRGLRQPGPPPVTGVGQAGGI